MYLHFDKRSTLKKTTETCIITYELEVVTDLPRFDTWEGVKSHDGGDILQMQVSIRLSSYLTQLLKYETKIIYYNYN